MGIKEVKKIKNTNEITSNNHKSLKNKLVISLLLLSLVFVFCVGTVSAADNDTIYVNDTGGNDDNNGTSWEWAKKSIKNATGTVNINGTVYIADGNYTGAGNTNIGINKNMTIQGQSKAGTIINGTNSARIFLISSGITLKIQDLTLANGNVYPSDGGAICNNGNLTVVNCKFTNNYADFGGAILNNDNLTVSDSEFAGNNAYVNGGAIFSNVGTTLTVTNCTFTDNTCLIYDGGAILNDGNFTVINSTFTNNAAHGHGFGGAISNNWATSILTVINSTFSHNNADNYGGAIYNANPATLIIYNSTFTDNSARCGGAILNSYNFTLTGSTFTGNIAGEHGGAIYNGGNLNVTGSTFTGNNATGYLTYGGAIHSTGNLNVAGSIFTGNTADWAGGAISVVSGTFNVTGSTFTENIAGHGGAIYNWFVPIEVHFNRFYGNNATVADAGDAIRTDGTTHSTADVEYNWWGSNNPDFASLISGGADYTPWLFMTINANPTTIKNGETSLITASFNNLFDGETVIPLDPATGHMPDGTLVTFNTDRGSVDCKTVEKPTSNGIATATLFADETAGTAHLNATLDSQTLFVNVTITPKSSLYLTVTPGKSNPTVGDTVVYTLKVGNKGPDAAKDVVMTYIVPEGLEFVTAKVDAGKWSYDASTRTITWTIGDVPVGDPYLWINLRVVQAGQYVIDPVLSTSTYDPTINSDTQSLTVNAVTQTSTKTVKAASKTKTIPLQKTGLPLAGLVLAILAVLSGLTMSKRK